MANGICIVTTNFGMSTTSAILKSAAALQTVAENSALG